MARVLGISVLLVGLFSALGYSDGFVCPNAWPSATTTTTFGGHQICGTQANPVQCAQDYAVDYVWGCALTAANKCCAAGTVTLSLVVTYSCDSKNNCKKNENPISGPGPVKGHCANEACNEGAEPPSE